MRKKSIKIPLSSFCVGHLLLGMGPAFKYGLSPSETSLKKTKFFLSKQVSIAGNFLVRGGSLCPLPPLGAGTSSGLSLCRPCVCCQSVSSYMHHDLEHYMNI